MTFCVLTDGDAEVNLGVPAFSSGLPPDCRIPTMLKYGSAPFLEYFYLQVAPFIQPQG